MLYRSVVLSLHRFNELMKIVRLTPHEFRMGKRFDLLRFDQNHVVRILHFAFDEQKGFFSEHEAK